MSEQKEHIQQDALELVRNNMRDYALYIAEGRSYNCILDGAKAAYKRAIYGMHENNTHKVVKVAELAAFALPYHPHPTSISSVIVALGDNGNKLKLMETQGNWGDSSKKIKPSADRYIGGYLSNLAEHLCCDSIEYCNYVKGEIDKEEPEALPALLPLCFINGSQGIPAGLPTLNVPTLDIVGMIDYYVDILKHKDLNYKPSKFPMPNLEIDIISPKDDWNTIMETGRGSLKTAPSMEISKTGVITIKALPGSKNIEHVRKLVEKEILLDKLDIRDESTVDTCIVIEKVPHKQCNMQEIYKKLYTRLQSSETFNMAFYDSDKIYIPCGFDKVVKANLNYVINTQKKRIKCEIEDLKSKLEVLQVIEKLKHDNQIKQLVDMTNSDAIKFISNRYAVDEKVSSKAMQKPLSYLTKEHDSEMLELIENIAHLENDDSDIYEFMTKKYTALKKEINSAIKGKFKPTRFIGDNNGKK